MLSEQNWMIDEVCTLSVLMSAEKARKRESENKEKKVEPEKGGERVRRVISGLKHAHP
jgi:hypothetical protein